MNKIREETRHGVLAIVLFAAALFFALASFNYAGVAGKAIYGWLSRLFGAGFFAIPLILFLLGVSFLKSVKPNFITSRLFGGLAMFLSILGIISILVTDAGIDGRLNGGLVGRAVAAPLKSLLGLYSLIFLGAIIIIGLLVIFDAELRLPSLRFSPFNWFNRKKSLTVLNQTAGGNAASAVKADASAAPAETEIGETEETKIVRDEKKRSDKPPAPKKIYSQFTPPPLSLLASDSGKPTAGDIKANANIIKRTLLNFGINVEMDEVTIGPSITRYAFKPAEGVKLSRIVTLQNDLSLALAAHPIRIEAPIPGRSLVGIEIPNSVKSIVGLAPLLGSREFSESPAPLLVTLGRDISGFGHFPNLGKAPHILVAGATGSGKSVVIHAFLASLLYRHPPERLRFILIDPKRVELTLYNGIPHLLTPVITEPKKAILTLKWAAKEMERRYHILSANSVRDISSYHKEEPDKMPYIVIVLDELADIMATYGRELEAAIIRLAQMSRAVGIHLILSTQRPSVEVITGLIKANIPTRVALQVTSQVDSRTILDMAGAEKLLGAGDLLYLSSEMSKPVRLQGAFVSEDEVKRVTDFLKKKYAAEYLSGLGEDISISEAEPGWQPDLNFDDVSGEESDEVLYGAARELSIGAGKASASYLQRKLKIGYARAARLLDMLEERGVIGPADGAKQRIVYEKPAALD